MPEIVPGPVGPDGSLTNLSVLDPLAARPLSPAPIGKLRAPVELPARPAVSRRRVVLLPTLNEEKGLEVTLRQIAEVPFAPEEKPDLIVVDGRSTDRTREVAREWGVPVLEQKGRGKGSAIRESLQWAAEHHYASIAVMDADATYPASALPAMFDLLESGRDLVVGIRRPETPPTTSIRDMVHRVGNSLLNYFAAQFSGQPLLDVCSGFWGLQASTCTAFLLESDGFEIEAELFLKSFGSGLRVAQIPIAYRPRVGEAKLHAVRDGARILLAILKHSFPARGAVRPQLLDGRAVTSADLNALLLALAPDRVVILGSPERLGEADRIAERVVRIAPDAQIITAALSPASLSEGMGPDPLTTPSRDTSSPVVIALPPLRDDGDTETLVGIPRTSRYFRILEGKGTNAAAYPRSYWTIPDFQRERIPLGRYLGAWYILGATLEPSWTLRELALLGSIPMGAPPAVYRRARAPVAPAASRRSPISVPLPRFLETSHR
jgi:dolichol-phosphate hexosyltransferase